MRKILVTKVFYKCCVFIREHTSGLNSCTRKRSSELNRVCPRTAGTNLLIVWRPWWVGRWRVVCVHQHGVLPTALRSRHVNTNFLETLKPAFARAESCDWLPVIRLWFRTSKMVSLKENGFCSGSGKSQPEFGVFPHLFFPVNSCTHHQSLKKKSRFTPYCISLTIIIEVEKASLTTTWRIAVRYEISGSFVTKR